MELHLEALDAMVAAYLDQGGGGQTCRTRAEAEAVRHMLVSADFDAAAARLRQLCPTLADNPWLVFQLKKQQFLHMASLAADAAEPSSDGSGDSKAARAAHQQAALALARRELAPLAMHAYCEAYADFKASMLALVTGGGGAAGLQEFAGMVARATRQEVGCGDSQLAQLLRYLLLLHQHQAQIGFHPFWWPDVSAATEALAGRLLLAQHDALPPAALEPSCGPTPGGPREHDVQALRISLGCDREEAVALLRRNRGSASAGLRDALLAAHLDEALLAELAGEYAALRGLEVAPAADERQELAADTAQAALQDGEQPRRPSKVARKGPADSAAAVSQPASPSAEPLQLPAELSEQQLRDLMQRVEGLLGGGRADAVLEQLEAAEPGFLPLNPAVAFALHRCRFLQHLAAGGSSGTDAALAIVRQHLSPLAQQHPELQGQLKAALAQLLPLPGPAEEGGGQKQLRQGVAEALAAMRASLRPRCHIREPRLLPLLRDLLSLHAAHFKLQRCQDRFAADLGIPALKRSPSATPPAPSPSGPAAGGTAAAAAMAAEAQQALAAAGGRWGPAEVPVPGVREVDSDSDGDEEMLGASDDAILTVCEFTGLPRHAAIELLLMHGGDPTAVLAHVFP